MVPGAGSGSEVCTTSCQAGVAGNGTGQLNGPNGVTAACDGQIYVTEVSGVRVQRFGEPGTPKPPCATSQPPVEPPANPPPGNSECEQAQRKLDKAKAKLKKLKKKEAAKPKVKKAKKAVKKAKAEVKKAC